MTEAKLNPDIREVEYGVRELKSVKLYPLSVHDELELTESIKSALIEKFSVASKLMKEGDEKKDHNVSDAKIFDILLDFIKENIIPILDLVVDPNEKIDLKDLTNNQLTNIVTIVFDTNFEEAVKNSKALVEKGKILFGLTESLPESSEKPPTT